MGLSNRERNTEQLSLRIPKDLLEQLDRVADIMNKEYPGLGFKRTDATRTILQQGVDRFLKGEDQHE